MEENKDLKEEILEEEVSEEVQTEEIPEVDPLEEMTQERDKYKDTASGRTDHQKPRALGDHPGRATHPIAHQLLAVGAAADAPHRLVARTTAAY